MLKRSADLTGEVLEKDPGSVVDREGPGSDKEPFCWREASLLVKASTVDEGEPGAVLEGCWVNISDDDGDGKGKPSEATADEAV